MMKAKVLGTALFLAALSGLALVAAGPTSAMPGWLDSGQASLSSHPSINEKQRDQIKALHSAYRAALSKLDWSTGENGHSPDTMQQAKELRMALRAEISDVLRRGSEVAGSSSESGCPYSGQRKPVKFGDNVPTLVL
ncbi:MAG TPA: hypothetical protein VKO85_00575 [Wenzhouxiangellaceae bacterium]|nr:hypothetical protein [Wenzhouxiangellaceae bacterium]